MNRVRKNGWEYNETQLYRSLVKSKNELRDEEKIKKTII